MCLIGSETKGTVRFKIYGQDSESHNYVIPGGPVTGQKHWKLLSRGGRDHFLFISDGLPDFRNIFDFIYHTFAILINSNNNEKKISLINLSSMHTLQSCRRL